MNEADKAFLGRVARLQGDLEGVQGRLWAQHDVLLRLQSDASALKDRYASLQERAAAALEALKAAEPLPPAEPSFIADLDPEPVDDLPKIQTPTPIPAPALETRFYGDALPQRSPRLWLPYAALALAAAAMTLGLPRVYSRRAAAAPPAPVPAPAPNALRAVMPLDFSANDVPPPAPIDGGVSPLEADAAVKLVYQNSSRVADILRSGARPTDASPWVVERSEGGKLMVTLRPGGDDSAAPIYEFEVDPARGTVQPSQETQDGLQGVSRLASRG